MVPMVILPILIWRKEVDANGAPIINPETGVQVETLLGERVFIAALIMGAIGFISFLFMIRKITVRVPESAVKVSDGARFNVFRAFANFMKNRAAIGATLAAMAMFLGMNSASTAISIMFAIYFGQARLSGVVSVIGFLPTLFFMPFIKRIVAKWGKKEAAAVGSLVSVGGGVLMFLFPSIENKSLSLAVYMISLAVFGIGMAIYTCVSWALMADAIDYNEWKTGNREEGTVYSLHSFFRKLSQGIGPSVVLLIMGALGYVSELGTNGQSAVTAANMCWLVAGLYLFSAVLMFISLAFVYNLDRKTMRLMQAELGARREDSENILPQDPQRP